MEVVGLRGLLLLVLRLVVAGVFVLAALPKIQDPGGFAAAIRSFHIVGPETSAWIALLLPWLELVVGVGLVMPMLRRTSAILIALLLLGFIGLHASAWARGLDLECGCFGAEGGVISDYRWLILRNAALFLATLFVLRRDMRNLRQFK